MRLAIPIIAALLLFAGLAQAAEVPTDKGDKAMVFMFHGLDDLGLGAYGGGLGMRYYFADHMAIRGAVILDMYSETCEPSSMDDPDDPDYEYSSTDIGIELVFEKHLEGCGSSVSPYIGVGGSWASVSTEEKNFYADYYGYWVDSEKFDGTSFGIFGVVGFEWAFTDCMTLGGEYMLGWNSTSGETEVDFHEDEPIDDWKSGECSYTMTGFGTASVFLSVYW